MRYYWLMIIGAAVLLIAFIFAWKGTLLKSPGNCTIIYQGEGKANVVFLSDGLDENKAKEYSDFLINAEPYAEGKEKFNFYYAGQADCEIVQGNILFCYSREIIKQAANCKNDFIIVLSSKQGNLRSSAYGNVMSLNINQPKNVILHEFGHAFANLADEYVPSEIPRGSKNCEKSCDNFAVKDGCFSGCSKTSYSRSTDNSIMRTLSNSEYGKLNTQLIENELQKY